MNRWFYFPGELKRVPGTLRTLLLPVCVALCAGGCFRMVNVDPASAPTDEDLRVQLTPAAAERVSNEFGTVGPRLVGRIAPSGADSIAIDAWLGQIYTDASFASARLVIPLHRSEVVEVQRRELSVKRTVFATIAGAGMIAILLSRTTLFEAEGGDDGEPGPPPPPEDGFAPRARFVISVPLRFGR